MTSDNLTQTLSDFQLNETIYIPFWVVLDQFDATPPDPFLKGTIRKLGFQQFTSPEGLVEFAACDLELKPELIAYNIPISYLIKPDQLTYWATQLGLWFSTYASASTEK